MSPCSVAGDKSCQFCCADVIQQPQGSTSPPVSVSRKMHSPRPVLDKSRHMCAGVCGSACVHRRGFIFHILHLCKSCVVLFKQKAAHVSA